MRHGSLFNGIGGFQLAAQWMGWENVFSCEIDKFCNKVTKHHFPNCIQHEDIKTTDFRIYRGRIDIITGGFPCQPFSTAGRRKGKNDERYLWPEMLRAIREIQPNWIVGENVFGILNWSRGLVFEQVHADLEAEGYITQAYVLPACCKNAPHKRDRVWFVAHMQKMDGIQSYKKKDDRKLERQNEHRGCFTQTWTEVAARVCRVDDGVPRRMDVGTISGKDWEENSLAGLGNAIVPQVAHEIFKAIEQIKCST